MTEAKCLCGHDKDSHGGGVGWCLYHKGRDECVCPKFVPKREMVVDLSGFMYEYRELQERYKTDMGQVWPETLDEKEPHIIHAAIALGQYANTSYTMVPRTSSKPRRWPALLKAWQGMPAHIISISGTSSTSSVVISFQFFKPGKCLS